MATRFDAHFATPEAIELPQGYDEFLTKDKIPCLIPGCGWRGKSLGIHMNMMHNIPADEFKMMAGFNLTTGLCTQEMSDRLRSRPHLKVIFTRERMLKIRERLTGEINGYKSLEGKEHRQKSRVIKETMDDLKPARICRKCGEGFRQSSAFGRRLYCYDCRPSPNRTVEQDARQEKA